MGEESKSVWNYQENQNLGIDQGIDSSSKMHTESLYLESEAFWIRLKRIKSLNHLFMLMILNRI